MLMVGGPSHSPCSGYQTAARECRELIMYKSFYQLQASPFGTSPDPRFLYMMPHTREALACLEYGISARKGFTVLTG